jgi:putative hydrolase of the HAD superfamily
VAAIQAVTFDLWDTIVHDDSDEPKRRARGLRSKKQERRFLVWTALQRHQQITADAVDQAYDVADAAFNTVWHDQHVTWTIRTRLEIILRGLGRTLPENEFEELIHAHEVMEVDVPPDLIPGCAEALAELSGRYELAIVSDAIVTPGRCLRDLLELYDVKDYFGGFAFSDEVGHSKPHRDMFSSAADQLGVSVDAMLHVGDREHNDIQGPHRLGMRAVLFTATRDVDKPGNSADAVCESYADLPGIIDSLASQPTN